MRVDVHPDANTSILKRADAGVPVKELCRHAGMSVATWYQWNLEFCGMEASELRRDMLMKDAGPALLMNKPMRRAVLRDPRRLRVIRT